MPLHFKQTPYARVVQEKGVDRGTAAILGSEEGESYLHNSLADGHVPRRKVYHDWLTLPLGSSFLQGVWHCCCEQQNLQ